MATKKEQLSKEDILKELHDAQENDSNNSDEDLDLGLEQLKAQKKATLAASDPISEEKQRHQQNLMQDIYDNLSDDDDEDEEEQESTTNLASAKT